jgi:murein DD-endopeptidase MepM/ murein hydrolase activator NlpD
VLDRRTWKASCRLLAAVAFAFTTALGFAAPSRAQDNPPPIATEAPAPDPNALPIVPIEATTEATTEATIEATTDPSTAPITDTNPEGQPDNSEVPTAEIVIAATPEPTDTPEPTPDADDPLAHIVQVGESLYSLSAQTGFSVNDLGERNALTNPYLLLAGQKLAMPAPPSNNIQLHRVTPGETLLSIAAQYGVSPYLLKQTNQLPCSTCLVYGQALRVRVPQAGTASPLPEPFENITVSPNIPKQGQVIEVRVQSRGSLQEISGSLADRPLNFTIKDDAYVALSGVDALQDAGVYPVTIRAIAEDGTAAVVNGRVQIGAGRYPFENLNVATKLVPLLDPQVNQDERDALDEILSGFSGTQYWEGPLQLPIRAKLVSLFGARRNFNRGTLMTYHSGVDMSVPVGTPVKASAPGRVAATEPFPVRGNVIILDHGRGVYTIYCHLSKYNVQVGQLVNVGDVIGYTGNTGRILGPHLHWELAVGGVTVDPLPWTKEALP